MLEFQRAAHQCTTVWETRRLQKLLSGNTACSWFAQHVKLLSNRDLFSPVLKSLTATRMKQIWKLIRHIILFKIFLASLGLMSILSLYRVEVTVKRIALLLLAASRQTPRPVITSYTQQISSFSLGHARQKNNMKSPNNLPAVFLALRLSISRPIIVNLLCSCSQAVVNICLSMIN